MYIETPNFVITCFAKYLKNQDSCRFLTEAGIKLIQDKIKKELKWVVPSLSNNGQVRSIAGVLYIEWKCQGKTGSCRNEGALICEQFGEDLKTIRWKLIHSTRFFCQHIHLIKDSLHLEDCKRLQHNFPSYADPVKYCTSHTLHHCPPMLSVCHLFHSFYVE